MRCMRRFPWRILSRQWGILAHTKLKPHFLNAIVIYIYAWLFDCKIEEAERSKISQFESLGDFFVRTLKPGVRPVDQSTAVVSPADGTATFNGSFKGGFLEQVNLQKFFNLHVCQSLCFVPSYPVTLTSSCSLITKYC